MDPGSHVGFPISTKNNNLVYDHTMNISAKFGSNRSCGRKRCVREINVSRAGDPVHAGDKALTRETPAIRGRVNRYGFTGTPALMKNAERYEW
jgi:hypothetical protein